MIDVCSGEANVEDEIKATDSLEAQVRMLVVEYLA